MPVSSTCESVMRSLPFSSHCGLSMLARACVRRVNAAAQKMGLEGLGRTRVIAICSQGWKVYPPCETNSNMAPQVEAFERAEGCNGPF